MPSGWTDIPLNSSQTIIDCLVNAAKAAGVKLRPKCAVEKVTRRADGQFELTLSGRSPLPRINSGERIKVRGKPMRPETTNPHPDPLPLEKGEGTAVGNTLSCDTVVIGYRRMPHG